MAISRATSLLYSASTPWQPIMPFDWTSSSRHCSSAAEIFHFRLIRLRSNARNSISRHATFVSKRNKFALPLSTPGAKLLWLNSPSVTVNNIVIGEGRNGLLICDWKHFCQGECKNKHFCNVSQQILSEVVGPRLLNLVFFVCFVDGSNIHLVDFYDTHINDIWLFQNKYLDP